MYALEIDRVSKKFSSGGKEFYALRNVSLRVKQGEIFGLLGPNGAGKTTLLNIVIRILLPDTGNVKILGKDLASNRSILEKINFVSGETRFHWVLTIKDIMKFYGMAYSIPEKELAQRIEKLLNFFGLKELENSRFSNLSTGQRMRTILAKGLLNHPKLLLLDEPTLGLDPDIAIRVRNEIKRINRKFGTTILLTSHYMNEVEQLSGRIAFINKGEITDTGTVEKVKLKMFDTFNVIITVKKAFNIHFLQNSGFFVKGRRLRKTLSSGDDLSDTLSLLHKEGYEILNVETIKPTLEDYFIKILGEGNEMA